jgi:hypothetical protein
MTTPDSIQREILPIPDRKPIGLTTYDAKDPETKFPPITQLRPPTGAPNVLFVLLDDVGFGASSGDGHVGRTHALFFSMDETLEVGCDVGEPVSPDYGPRGNEFTGKIKWVQIDIDAAAKDADHMIGAEERFNLAMARQ